MLVIEVAKLGNIVRRQIRSVTNLVLCMLFYLLFKNAWSSRKKAVAAFATVMGAHGNIRWEWTDFLLVRCRPF